MEGSTLSDFENVYHRFVKLVFNTAYHILYSYEEAEEITQDVFIQFTQHQDNIHNKENPKYWLVKPATNMSLNHIKRKGRLENYVGSTIHRLKTHFHTITRKVALSQEVEAALLVLNEKERAMLVLKFVYDFKNQEIGETLGIPEGTVKSSLARLLDKLKKKGIFHE